MQARTSCQTCGTLLVLTHDEEEHWSLRCPKDGGFVNLTPGKSTLPESYDKECQMCVSALEDHGLRPGAGKAYEDALVLIRRYREMRATASCASAS
ncbi:MAG: hypothetical protein Q7S48_03660 [bacterium]|nr:hypothetical protein [bacterium]